MRLSIRQALQRIGKRADFSGAQSIDDAALLIETVAMGLVARAALGEEAEAERVLRLVVTGIVLDEVRFNRSISSRIANSWANNSAAA